MSDEQGTPLEGNSPDTDASVDWEQRYKDTQAAYTRSQQELKEHEGVWEDPDAVWSRASEKFGWTAGDDEPDPETDPYADDVEPDDEVRRELSELKDWRHQQEAQALQQDRQDNWTGWEQYVTEQAAEKGVELKRRDLKALMADCVGKDGYPVPQDQATKVLEEYVGEYFPQKERPKSPHVPGPGKPVTEGKPWSELNPQERLERQLELAAAMESQT